MFSFSLGRIPVVVHMPFVLVALLFASNYGRDVPLVGAFVVVMFLGILAHELGHALTGIAFGLEPRIDIHGMGGTTTWAHKNVSTAKKIAISVAGPLVGITIGVLAFFSSSVLGPLSPRAAEIVLMIVEVNAIWGVLNLLPILPLDGGNALAHALAHSMGQKGIRIARYVSIVVALAVGLVAFLNGWAGLYSLVLIGFFVVQNVRALLPEDGGGPPPAAQRW